MIVVQLRYNTTICIYACGSMNSTCMLIKTSKELRCTSHINTHIYIAHAIFFWKKAKVCLALLPLQELGRHIIEDQAMHVVGISNCTSRRHAHSVATIFPGKEKTKKSSCNLPGHFQKPSRVPRNLRYLWHPPAARRPLHVSVPLLLEHDEHDGAFREMQGRNSATYKVSMRYHDNYSW